MKHILNTNLFLKQCHNPTTQPSCPLSLNVNVNNIDYRKRQTKNQKRCSMISIWEISDESLRKWPCDNISLIDINSVSPSSGCALLTRQSLKILCFIQRRCVCVTVNIQYVPYPLMVMTTKCSITGSYAKWLTGKHTIPRLKKFLWNARYFDV